MGETALAIADSVRRGRSSARAQCLAALERIEAARDLNAIVAIDPALSLREAAAVDARLAAGADLALAGVPIVVKDLVWVKGRRIAQGSHLFADFLAPDDAAAVARLKTAGAVVAGIANSSEFGCKGVTDNPLFGKTAHPHDRKLTPGGSSGGCASAVGAGLVPVAIGTDSGGSSRRPAAHVGCVGFKPSTGAVPNGPGFETLDIGLDCLCPMGADVADVALAFETMAGRAAIASKTIRPADPLVALSPTFGIGGPVEADIEALLEDAVTRLHSAGIQIVEHDPVWPADPAALMPLQHAMLADLYGEAFRRDPHLFDPDIAVQIEAGLALDARAVSRALRLSKAIRAVLDEIFERFDAMIGLTAPCFAWRKDRLGPASIAGQAVGPRAHAALTPFLNHGGNPAISLPIGTGSAGLAAGLQLCGPRGADRFVLELAARFESALTAPNEGRRRHIDG